MSWYKPKTVRVDFGPLGYPDLYVELVHPKSLTLKDLRDLPSEASPEAMAKLLDLLVKEHNLTDPETDQPLGPLSEGAYKLPIEFLEHLNNKITELMGPSVPLPTESGS